MLFGKGEDDGEARIHHKVVWSVHWDVDDYKGPGWYVDSPRLDWNTEPGQPGGRHNGPFETKDDAIGYAITYGDEGDVVAIWDKERQRSEPVEMKYVRSSPDQ